MCCIFIEVYNGFKFQKAIHAYTECDVRQVILASMHRMRLLSHISDSLLWSSLF